MRIKGHMILAGAILLNGALIALLSVPWLMWRPNPNVPPHQDAQWHAAQICYGLATFLWIPFVVLLILGAIFTYRRQGQRALPANPCRACGYDRAGLATGAACPECGSPPWHHQD